MRWSNETKIGILVVTTVAALLVLTFKVGNFSFTKRGYIIKLLFTRIEGLEKNSAIRLNGLEAGQVRDIKITYGDETKMEITVWLNQDAKVREGAKAYIKTSGLLGEKYIELSGGDNGAPFLNPGSVIVGEDPVDFEKLLAKGSIIADNLKSISENLSKRLELNSQAIDDIIGNLNTTMKNFSSISSNVNERLTVNREAIDDIVTNLNVTSKNLQELSMDLKVNPWKLLYKGKDKNLKPLSKP